MTANASLAGDDPTELEAVATIEYSVPGDSPVTSTERDDEVTDATTVPVADNETTTSTDTLAGGSPPVDATATSTTLTPSARGLNPRMIGAEGGDAGPVCIVEAAVHGPVSHAVTAATRTLYCVTGVSPVITAVGLETDIEAVPKRPARVYSTTNPVNG